MRRRGLLTRGADSFDTTVSRRFCQPDRQLWRGPRLVPLCRRGPRLGARSTRVGGGYAPSACVAHRDRRRNHGGADCPGRIRRCHGSRFGTEVNRGSSAGDSQARIGSYVRPRSRVRDDGYVTQPYDPDRFEPLSDADKVALAPELAYRAGVVVRLVNAGMVRQPLSEDERRLAIELATLFPDEYRVDQ